MVTHETITIVPEIDPEILTMIPALAQEEESGLEADLLMTGHARRPLDVWLDRTTGNYILLDGHNRKRLCEKHSLPYVCRVVSGITTREEALAFVTSETVNRRNISPLARAILIGQQYLRETAQGTRGAGRAAERVGKRYGANGRTIELYARAARAISAIEEALSVDAAAAIKSGSAKMTREEMVEFASLEDSDLMRAVWEEWLRAGKAGLTKLIAKHKQGKQRTGPRPPAKPATERYGLADLVHLTAAHWTATAYAKAATTMDRNVLQVVDAHLPNAVRNLLMIGQARGLPVRGVVDSWLAHAEGSSAVEEINRAYAEQPEQGGTTAAQEPAQDALDAEPRDYPPEEPEAAPGAPWVDLEAVRQRMQAALDDGATMASLAREIGVTPQSAKNILAGSEPYAKTKAALADWMAG